MGLHAQSEGIMNRVELKKRIGDVGTLLIRENAAKGNLKPSFTAYLQWGNSVKRVLRFSKYGDQKIERAYATRHVLKAVVLSVSE